MKRTPLKPSTKPMKRSRLPAMSKKSRARIAAHHPQRVAWLKRFTHCMGCNKRFYSGAFSTPSVHEIYGGTAMRQVTFGMPSMWLALCFPCNQAMGSVPNRPRFVAQLALKITHDQPHFDLEEANGIWQRNGNQDPITLTELREFLDDEILSEER